MVNDGHAVAQLLRLFDVVRGQDDGLLFALQLFDDRVNLAAHLRVQSRRRLVQKKHLRIVHQRHRQRQPLLLPAGKLVVERMPLLFKPEALQQFIGISRALVEAGKQPDRLAHTQFVGKGSGLQRCANLVLQFVGVFLRIQSANRGPPAVGHAQSFQHFNRAGLSGAVRAQQPKHFALFHAEADAAHGFHFAVALHEIFDLQNGIRHG